MLLILDNYDSFTYNLVQYFGELGAAPVVHRNDALSVAEALALKPDAIVVSPGPGTPRDAGISIELIRAAAGRVPVLGVCLGHQAIGEAFGGRVVRAERLMHGKSCSVKHGGIGLFAGIPSPFTAMRYHSLLVERSGLPDDLAVTAWSADEEIMAMSHREHQIHGVQFHPESIGTDHGMLLLQNFLKVIEGVSLTP